MITAKEILEGWEEAVWLLDVATGHLTWTANSIKGVSVQGNGLQSWYSIIHPDDVALAQHALELALARKSVTCTSKYRILDTDGKSKSVFNKGIIQYENDVPTLVINTITDISAQCEAEHTAEGTSKQSLMATQQKLYTLVDNSVDLMSILELDGVNSYINKAGMEMLGFDTRQEVVDTPISELHRPEDFEQVSQTVLPSVMKDGRWAGTMMVRNRKTGEVFPVMNNTLRIDDPQTGKPIAVGAVMRDLRPEIVAKQALLESEQRYRTLSVELEERVIQRTKDLTEANKNLERSNVELEQYAYVASHDLQEPLRKIKIFSGMLADKATFTDDERVLLGKVMNSAERMTQLINDLLEFSRLLKADKRTRPTDLNVIMANVVTDFELVLKEKGAVLEIDPLPTIEAVPLQMNQLLYNLLSNSLKFSQEGVAPRIVVSCVPLLSHEVAELGLAGLKGNCYHIKFIDNGIGFDAQYAERIFEVFSRLHTGNVFPGSGIGLALCRRIVQNHKGVLSADSEIGKGTVMHVFLPEHQS